MIEEKWFHYNISYSLYGQNTQESFDKKFFSEDQYRSNDNDNEYLHLDLANINVMTDY